MDGQMMIYDRALEENILGDLMNRGTDSVRNYIEGLRTECFSEQNTRAIFTALRDLVNHGESVNLMNVVQECMKRDPKNDDLLNSIPRIAMNFYESAVELESEIRRLIDTSKRRELVTLGDWLTQNGVIRTKTIGEVLSETREKIAEIEATHSDGEVTMTKILASINSIVEDHVNGKMEDVIKTGFYELDRNGGLTEGSLNIIAAASSQGKTSFSDSIVSHIIKNGVKVAFYSLEMTNEELVARFCAPQTRVSGGYLLHSKLTDDEFTRWDKAYSYFYSNGISDNLYFDDKSSQNINSMLNSIRRMVNRNGVRVVVIDYIQLIDGMTSRESKEQFMGACARKLKNLAKELGIAVILLSQLNRDLDKDTKLPTINNLRDSGQIAEAADNVWLIYRPSFYNDTEARRLYYPYPFKNIDPTGTAMIIIGKCRNGQTSAFICKFIAEFTQFLPCSDYELPKITEVESDLL